MVAFVVSTLIAAAGTAAVVAFGRRRPVGADLSWGEAIAAATYAFFLMFWVYGVVPHQWLQWSGNELNWRPDRFLSGPGNVLGRVLPFEMSYETLSHLIVVGIYSVFLAGHVALWVIWQNRGKKRPIEIARSDYGRPLVRSGQG